MADLQKPRVAAEGHAPAAETTADAEPLTTIGRRARELTPGPGHEQRAGTGHGPKTEPYRERADDAAAVEDLMAEMCHGCNAVDSTAEGAPVSATYTNSFTLHIF